MKTKLYLSVFCSGHGGPAAHRTGLSRQQAAEDRLWPGPGDDNDDDDDDNDDDDDDDDDDDLVQDGAEKELLKEIELISGVQVRPGSLMLRHSLCRNPLL